MTDIIPCAIITKNKQIITKNKQIITKNKQIIYNPITCQLESRKLFLHMIFGK